MIVIQSIRRINSREVYLVWDDDAIIKRDYSIWRRLAGDSTFIKIGNSTSRSFIDGDIEGILNEPVYYISYGEEKSREMGVYNIGDNYLLKVASDMAWQLETAGNSVEAKVFSVQKTEKRCPVCYDPITEKVIKSNCSVCHGTSYITEYKGPAIIYVNIESAKSQYRDLGDSEDSIKFYASWTSNRLKLKRGDIILMENDDVYIVNNTPEYSFANSKASKGTFLLKQKFLLKRVRGYEWTLDYK